MKDEGLKSGVPDLFIPYPCVDLFGHFYGGAFIEMKRPGAPFQDSQRDWITWLREADKYLVYECTSADEAIRCIQAYLGICLDARVR